MATLWTVAHQSPRIIEFSRQEYWNDLLFPSPGDPPDPGINPRSPALQAVSLPSESPGEAQHHLFNYTNTEKGKCPISTCP